MAAEFDDLFERMSHFLESAAAMPSVAGKMVWVPLAEIRETDEAYVIEADLPGIAREDVDVEMTERELIITGELKEREREGILRRSTRRTGRFEYRALLPVDMKPEDVGATLDSGVLRVTVPKSKAAKPRHIEVTGKS